jgi:restriction endonuclease S subunit
MSEFIFGHRGAATTTSQCYIAGFAFFNGGMSRFCQLSMADSFFVYYWIKSSEFVSFISNCGCA